MLNISVFAILPIMKTSLFDYHLPKSRIAQHSVAPRDQSRLMILDRRTEKIIERHFCNIGDFLHPGDLLVVNDTKVFRARLFGKFLTGGAVELFLLRPVKSGRSTSTWEALARPGKKLVVGTIITGKNWQATIAEKRDGGVVVVAFPFSTKSVFELLHHEGHIPVPPYVKDEPKKESEYQTVYAKHEGSVAAPTAGFHFTPRLITQLKKRGIGFVSVTLHVGIGTFQPMMTDDTSQHVMHEECAEISTLTMRAIKKTKRSGGRVIVVGTTALRALEGLVGKSGKGFVNIFITPGYKFQIADGLITNFHLPKSTLLVLVSAFAGRDFIFRAYRRAMRQKFRFYSFGDAMLIL